MRLAAFALLAVVACRKEPARVDLPAPLPVAATATTTSMATATAPPIHVTLFPEDPTLDATEPADTFFAQETWTGATSQQHCREWGIDSSRENAVRDQVNTILAPRGIHLPDHTREKGVVVAMGAYAVGVVDHGPRIKLAVCTEGVAPKSAHEAFADRILASPRAPQSPDFAALGEPDVAWRRVHVSGEIEIGLRYPHPPSNVASRVIDAITHAHDPRFTAKLRGTDLWWTGLEKP